MRVRLLLAALLLASPALAQTTDTTRVPLVPRPAIVRGLYVNRWAAVGKKVWQLIDVAKRTEVNALVHDIYPIARIVVAKDPLPANAKREWAVQRRADGKPWLDANGNPWLDPHQ